MAGEANGSKRVRSSRNSSSRLPGCTPCARSRGLPSPGRNGACGGGVRGHDAQGSPRVRANQRQNIRDLAWAFTNSASAEEFEQRLGEIKTLPGPDGPRR